MERRCCSEPSNEHSKTSEVNSSGIGGSDVRSDRRSRAQIISERSAPGLATNMLSQVNDGSWVRDQLWRSVNGRVSRTMVLSVRTMYLRTRLTQMPAKETLSSTAQATPYHCPRTPILCDKNNVPRNTKGGPRDTLEEWKPGSHLKTLERKGRSRRQEDLEKPELN